MTDHVCLRAWAASPIPSALTPLAELKKEARLRDHEADDQLPKKGVVPDLVATSEAAEVSRVPDSCAASPRPKDFSVCFSKAADVGRTHDPGSPVPASARAPQQASGRGRSSAE